jgi:hypothetical protein
VSLFNLITQLSPRNYLQKTRETLEESFFNKIVNSFQFNYWVPKKDIFFGISNFNLGTIERTPHTYYFTLLNEETSIQPS